MWCDLFNRMNSASEVELFWGSVLSQKEMCLGEFLPDPKVFVVYFFKGIKIIIPEKLIRNLALT